MHKKFRVEDFLKGITWEDISNILKGVALVSSIIGFVSAPECPKCNRKQLFIGIGYICINCPPTSQQRITYREGNWY